MKKIYTFYKSYETKIVLFILTLLSFYTFLYYFYGGKLLLYGDANSRLNIARGIIDSLTPGLGQLSNVWLPLPTFLILPFVWNSYLWHSGIAGAIGSMAAFIIGGLYLYKSAKILSGSVFASLGTTLIYALNINMLYLQTTAMAEPLFITTIIIATYNFLLWIKNYEKMHYLIYAGIAVTAASLTRYEGWAILFSSIPIVAFYMWIKTKSYKQAEGKTILYTTVAMFGFILWALYLTALYGDPLYWKNIYLSEDLLATSKGTLTNYTFNLNIWQAGWKYLTAVIWMNGLIPTILAITAVPLIVYKSLKNKSFYFLPLLLFLSIFAFMILTLQRNTPINQPNLTLTNILSPKTHEMEAFNIRYGLLMLPLIALLLTYLFNIRFILFRLLLISLLAIQIYSYFKPAYSVIYKLPIGNNIDMIKHDPIKGNNLVKWLKKHYDGGLILISAQKYNAEMLELGYDFKTFIHEGTGKYWKESIKNPQKYATWIVFSPYYKEDKAAKFLRESPALKLYYNLVFDKDGMKVYKIKTKPDIEIKQ